LVVTLATLIYLIFRGLLNRIGQRSHCGQPPKIAASEDRNDLPMFGVFAS
jgi:hypothetical protein